jgi:hypothetical protein
MAAAGILVDFDDLVSFSPACQAELRSYVLTKLGANPVPPPVSAPASSGPADLDLAAAEMFLQNCSPKSIAVLKQIVARKGTFLLNDIASAMRVRQGGLGGVWGGLTKRTRTVTGDDDAKFVDWKWVGGKWHGRVSPVTAASLATALKNY